MDVDGQCDEKLLHAFRNMNTQDKEVLIKEFQRVLGQEGHDAGVTDKTAEFFLDMNDWNLQSALCSYCDLGNSVEIKMPSMAFVRDITIGEGESVPPNTRFTKTWCIANTGGEPWPSGCALVLVEGQPIAHVDRVWIDPLGPGAEMEISVEMTSPTEQGIYQTRWCTVTPNGVPFGETIWCIIVVEDSGLLSLTQRLASTSCRDTTTQGSHHLQNSPTAPAAQPYQVTGGSAGPFGAGQFALSSQQQHVTPPSAAAPANSRFDANLVPRLGDQMVPLYSTANSSSKHDANESSVPPGYINKNNSALPAGVSEKLNYYVQQLMSQQQSPGVFGQTEQNLEQCSVTACSSANVPVHQDSLVSNSTLYAAVSSALPVLNQRSEIYPQRSMPVNIPPRCESQSMEEWNQNMPMVPPCTPSTPSQMSFLASSSSSVGGENPSVLTPTAISSFASPELQQRRNQQQRADVSSALKDCGIHQPGYFEDMQS